MNIWWSIEQPSRRFGYWICFFCERSVTAGDEYWRDGRPYCWSCYYAENPQ
jgi:hypothetical protein